MGPLPFVSVSAHTIPAAVHALTVCPCNLCSGRVASNSEYTAHWWQPRGVPRTTAPPGAASSHMSYTPNSEASLLWSPGDDESESFPPSPVPTAPAASTASTRAPPAVGTLLEACWAGLFAEGAMPRRFFVSWSMSSTRSDRTPLPAETTLLLPMS